MYLYLHNENVPGFTVFYQCFSTTQWTFLFETAVKRAVKYVNGVTQKVHRCMYFYETRLIVGLHAL